MRNRYLLPLIAVIGALIALGVVFWSQRKIKSPEILYPPPKVPYKSFIAGAGAIEASSLNIQIGSPFSEVVTKVFVVEGDRVKKGDPLFQLDLRTFSAQAEAASAALKESEVALQDKKVQFSFYERLRNKSAVSEEQYFAAYYAMKEAEAHVTVAQGELKIAMSNIERSLIRAPMDAFVLQVNVRPGTIAPTVPLLSTEAILMVLGVVSPLNVRVDIDQEDAWRYKEGSNAVAFVRGNSNLSFPLQFVRVEPFIVPKASFTGDTTERIDTRVLQVLYSFDWGTLPIYPGQIVDVFIESKEAEPKRR